MLTKRIRSQEVRPAKRICFSLFDFIKARIALSYYPEFRAVSPSIGSGSSAPRLGLAFLPVQVIISTLRHPHGLKLGDFTVTKPGNESVYWPPKEQTKWNSARYSFDRPLMK